MIIDKELFDECFCPCEGIARVCLDGSKGIPEEAIKLAKEIADGEYMESCFSIEIHKNGATISYMGELDFHELAECDNYEEVLKYYKANADKDDLEETFKEW